MMRAVSALSLAICMIFASFSISLNIARAEALIFIEEGEPLPESSFLDDLQSTIAEKTDEFLGFLHRKSVGLDPIEKDPNSGSNRDQPRVIIYTRIAHSPYILAEDQLYWRQIETIESSDCIICPRMGGKTSITTQIHYLPVEVDLDLESLTGFGSDSDYLTDKKQVIYQNKLIPNIQIPITFDPAQYRYEGQRDQFLLMDTLLFHQGRLLPVNGQHFEWILDNLYKDDQAVYHLNHMILDADPRTFEVVNDYFVQDKNHVWRNDGKYSVTDIAPGLERLNCQYREKTCPYLKNAEAVYFQDQKIEEADILSFEVMRLSCLADRALLQAASFTDIDSRIYPVTGLPHELSQIYCTLPDLSDRRQKDDEWARDKNHVYFRGKIESSLDPQSSQLFYLGGERVMLDQNHLYFGAQKDSLQYSGFLVGPIPEDSLSYSRAPILADENGFFTFGASGVNDNARGKPLYLCDYSEGEPTGNLSVLRDLPAGIAYGFEDDRFEYYIKTAYDSYEADQRVEHKSKSPEAAQEAILAKKDYIIDKRSGEKYAMFNHFMINQCSLWDEIEVDLR